MRSKLNGLRVAAAVVMYGGRMQSEARTLGPVVKLSEFVRRRLPARQRLLHGHVVVQRIAGPGHFHATDVIAPADLLVVVPERDHGQVFE